MPPVLHVTCTSQMPINAWSLSILTTNVPHFTLEAIFCTPCLPPVDIIVSRIILVSCSYYSVQHSATVSSKCYAYYFNCFTLLFVMLCTAIIMDKLNSTPFFARITYRQHPSPMTESCIPINIEIIIRHL